MTPTAQEMMERIQATMLPVPIVRTGLGSLDDALGGGLRLKSRLEIAGPEFSGKTTLSMALAARMSAPDKRIIFVDLEGVGDGKYALLAANAYKPWTGSLWVAPMDHKVKTKNGTEIQATSHTDRADYALAEFDKEDVVAMVYDSLGNHTSGRALEGSIGDANMGQAAKEVTNFYAIFWNKTTTKEAAFLFAINHLHQKLDGKGGSETSRGKAPRYNSDYRIRVWSKHDSDEVWTIQGEVRKRRSAGTGDFAVEMVPQEGIHWGLTAVQDCCRWGLASLSTVVKMDGKSYGYYSKIVEKRDDEEMLRPFIEAASKYVEERWPKEQ